MNRLKTYAKRAFLTRYLILNSINNFGGTYNVYLFDVFTIIALAFCCCCIVFGLTVNRLLRYLQSHQKEHTYPFLTCMSNTVRQLMIRRGVELTAEFD